MAKILTLTPAPDSDLNDALMHSVRPKLMKEIDRLAIGRVKAAGLELRDNDPNPFAEGDTPFKQMRKDIIIALVLSLEFDIGDGTEIYVIQ